MTSATRHVQGLIAIAGAWVAGLVVESLIGFPAPISGLLILAVVLLVSPPALDRLAPTADATIRWLPLLFVPVTVGGATALVDADTVALLAAVVVSVPVGFVVVATLAR